MAIKIPKDELNEFSLPRVCVATGMDGKVTFRSVNFQYLPKWTAIFALAPVLYFIFYFLMRKTASGTLPFSDQAWKQVKLARRNILIAALGMFGAMFLSFFLIEIMPDVGVIALAGSVVVGLTAIIITSLKIKKVHPFATFIDSEAVYLNLPSFEAERAITRHLNSGAQTAI